MIYETMRSRRSVRRFKPDRPDRATILKLIEAAITAPSAGNRQPWRFLILTNRESIERLAGSVREAVDRVAHHIEPAWQASFRTYGDYFTRFEEAPAVIVPLSRSLTLLSNMVDQKLPGGDRERILALEARSGLIGTSLAIQNLLLMAHSLGLGASCMTGPLIAVDCIRRILDVPDSWQVVAMIPVGFPAEEPSPTERRPVDKVARWIE
ncbi:MAG: nitroreductase family protein [Planctomycetota bacterium]|jgi:nitroreductase